MNSFKIIGQSALVDRLRNIISSGRVVHSYIFTGARGSGKKTIASLFIRGLLCQNPMDKPCDACRSCRQFLSGNHPDVHRVIPEKDKKSIGVDVIRDMQADIKLKPFQGDKKIYLIEQADIMTDQAQNALLKILEEPPVYTVLILLAEHISHMFPTVLSRCQIFRIPRLSSSAVCQIIQRQMNISENEAAVFAGLSDGLPGKGLELAGSDKYRQLRNQTLEIIQDIHTWTELDAIEYKEFFMEHKNEIADILDIVLLWLRDLAVFKEAQDQNLIVNMDRISSIELQARAFTIGSIQGMIYTVQQTIKMFRSNVNYQLAIENMLLALQTGGEFDGTGSRSTF